MLLGRSAGILRHLELPEAHDRELLCRFAHNQDQTAFAELVKRHGPLVFSVCKRVTYHEQDAEDAFQAVFLVLARKATAVKNPELLGSWLYGVAVRIACRARRAAVRRARRETLGHAMSNQATHPGERDLDLERVIDEEVAALPSWYRTAILLCNLQGLSRPEAARALGVPEGTLSSRPANGRKRLALRLSKRGISLPTAGLGSVLLIGQLNASCELQARAVSLVAAWQAGGVVPNSIVRLVKGGVNMRQPFLIGVIVAATLPALVFALQPPEQPRDDESKQPSVREAITHTGVEAIADDKPDRKPGALASSPRLRDTLDLNLNSDLFAVWNEQGDRLAVAGNKHVRRTVPLQGGGMGNGFQGGGGRGAGNQGTMNFPTYIEIENSDRRSAFLISVPAGGSKIASLAPLGELRKNTYFQGFTPDGQGLLTVHREFHLLSGIHQLDFWKDSGVNLEPGEVQQSSVAMRVLHQDRAVNLETRQSEGYYFSRDGKTFRTVGYDRDAATGNKTKLYVFEVDTATGKETREFFSVKAGPYAMSRDGKRFAILEDENTVAVYEVDRGERAFTYKLTNQLKAKNVEPLQVVRDSNNKADGGGGGPKGGRFGRGDRPDLLASPWMTFSADGTRLLLYGGIGQGYWNEYQENEIRTYVITSGAYGQYVVLNAETGAAYPALENLEATNSHSVDRCAFSLNGKLLVVTGYKFSASPCKLLTQVRGKAPMTEDTVAIQSESKSFIGVWDTETGKQLKNWDATALVSFNPVRPVLAILESNGDETRLGLWDFSAEMPQKK